MSRRRLPGLEKVPTPPWQRKRLSRWLREWRLAVDLEKCRGELEPRAVRMDLAGPDESGGVDLPPAAGQVRLMYPVNRATWYAPVYILLLRPDRPDRFLAVPFGRFAEPAVPAELLTGRRSPPLRVLCLWNARRVNAEVAGRSWHVADFPADGIGVVLTAYRRTRDGDAPPPELARRAGPPLVHPEDPRHVYLCRERLRLDCVLREARTVYPLAGAGDLPMAAEDREPYGSGPARREAGPGDRQPRG